MLNAKKCLKAGSILLAGTMLLSVFPMMTLAKPAIEVITHAVQEVEPTSIHG